MAWVGHFFGGNCTGCGLCAKKCPTQAITGEKKGIHVIDEDLCIKCDTCRQVCNFDAVKVWSGRERPEVAGAGRQGT
jgi:ferredoxin